MSRQNVIALAVSLVLALLIGFWLVVPSTSFQGCRDPQSAARHEQQLHPSKEGIAAFPETTGLRECVGYFVSVNSEALTALSTIFLAAITLGLVWLGLLESDTRRAELRSYVFVDSVSLFSAAAFTTTAIDRTGQAGVTITIKNSGATPAKDVIHWGEIQAGPLSQEWSMNAPNPLKRFSLSMIAPGGINNKNRWLGRPLSQTEADGILAGTYAIYAFGRIEYRDAFGAKHWATYRMKYTDAAWPPIGNSASMSFCDDGNDST